MKRLTLETFQSFVTLAHRQKMSEAVEQLSITRQTIKRHIEAIEANKGEQLLRLDGHRYLLTTAGAKFLPQVEELIQQADAMTGGYELKSETINGLNRISLQTDKGEDYRSQQHPLFRLWIDSPPLLQHAYSAWSSARFRIESPQMEDIKPYLLLHRSIDQGWICTHVGEKSAYALWFGWEWARSAIGSQWGDDPGGKDYDKFASKPYQNVLRTGGARLDHHHIKQVQKPNGKPIFVRYQRLLMCFILPDGEPILGGVAAFTNNIEISGFELTDSSKMDQKLLMDFNI